MLKTSKLSVSWWLFGTTFALAGNVMAAGFPECPITFFLAASAPAAPAAYAQAPAVSGGYPAKPSG